MTFTIESKEKESFDRFDKEHKNCHSKDALAMKYSFTFTPGGAGTVIEVKCNVCGKTENITDFENW
jgi:hypothetical protein